MYLCTDRQTDRMTDRQTRRQTDRRTDIESYTLIPCTFTDIQDGDTWANAENRPTYEHVSRKHEETAQQSGWPGEENVSVMWKLFTCFSIK